MDAPSTEAQRPAASDRKEATTSGSHDRIGQATDRVVGNTQTGDHLDNKEQSATPSHKEQPVENYHGINNCPTEVLEQIMLDCDLQTSNRLSQTCKTLTRTSKTLPADPRHCEQFVKHFHKLKGHPLKQLYLIAHHYNLWLSHEQLSNKFEDKLLIDIQPLEGSFMANEAEFYNQLHAISHNRENGPLLGVVVDCDREDPRRRPLPPALVFRLCTNAASDKLEIVLRNLRHPIYNEGESFKVDLLWTQTQFFESYWGQPIRFDRKPNSLTARSVVMRQDLDSISWPLHMTNINMPLFEHLERLELTFKDVTRVNNLWLPEHVNELILQNMDIRELLRMPTHGKKCTFRHLFLQRGCQFGQIASDLRHLILGLNRGLALRDLTVFTSLCSLMLTGAIDDPDLHPSVISTLNSPHLTDLSLHRFVLHGILNIRQCIRDNIVKLDLSRCIFTEQLVVCCAKLETLSVARCCLHDLPDLRGAPKLSSLNLQSNSFKPTIDCRALPSGLVVLDVSDNIELNFLDARSLTKLKTLKIAMTSLTSDTILLPQHLKDLSYA